MTVQLIGKDDSSFDDSEVLTGRWQAYIDSFVSVRRSITRFVAYLINSWIVERRHRGCSNYEDTVPFPPPVRNLQFPFAFIDLMLLHVSRSQESACG